MKLALFGILLLSIAGCASTPRVLDDDSLRNYNYLFMFEAVHVAGASGDANPVFMSLFIYNNGRRFTDSNVEEMRIRSSRGEVWKLSPVVTNRYIGGYSRLLSLKLSKDGSIQSIEPYSVEIDTRDGTTYREVIEPSRFLRGGLNNATIVAGRPAYSVVQGELPFLAFANLTMASVDSSGLNLKFIASDDRIRSAKIWLFNDRRVVIGQSPELINTFTGRFEPSLNEGQGLYTDGRENSVHLPVGSIVFEHGDRSLLDAIRHVTVDAYSDQPPNVVALISKDSFVMLTHSPSIEVVSEK